MVRILLLLFIANSFATIAQNTTKNDDSEEMSNLNDYQSITFNGIWSWFSDPRAVYYEGTHKRTYTGWVDNYGDIHIAYYDHDTKNIKSKVVFDNLEIDDHNNPSILIDDRGILMVFFTSHLQSEKPIYILKSNSPETIDDWNPIKELFLNDPNYYTQAKSLNHTYTNPIKLSAENDKIFLFYRGIDFKPMYSTSIDNGETWSKGRILFMPNEVNSLHTPYTKVYSDGISKIHFTFTDGHPTKETSNNLYYMYYESGNFYKANGTKIKTLEQLPIKQQDLDIIYKQTSSNDKVWNWDIAQNENGDPVIVYVKFPDTENHIYTYAIWENNQWINNDIVNSGNWFPETPANSIESEPHYSGGITIDHSAINTLYLSIKRQGVFEIEKWVTKDYGKTWDIKKITSNSSKNNIRPFAIRNVKKGNGPQLLWIQNTKYINYSLIFKNKNTALKFKDRYQTAIKMDIKYPKMNNDITKEAIIQNVRELVDWQLENLQYDLKKTDYKYGLFLEGINAFYSITNEVRYKNELLNIIQYENEEEDETLPLENLIWYFNVQNNRPLLNKLNNVSTENIKQLDKTIRTPTLMKLLSIINEDDNIEKTALKKLYLEYVNDLLESRNEYLSKKKMLSNAFTIYILARAINNGILPLDHKEKTIESWIKFSTILEKKEYKNSKWEISLTGATLLANKEIYHLLEKQ